MSIAGFSMAESVYYEEPYTVPGPCKTCCLRCPCPNLITSILFLLGVAGFCVGVVLATDETVNLFLWNTTLKTPLSNWLLYVKIGVAVGTAVLVILCVLMLAMAYLGTGATRKEFVCRFRTRAKGRCQTAMVLTIAYVLLLIWLIILLITLIPTFFFSVQARGICRSVRDDENPERYFYECLDLRQWGLIDYNPNAEGWADPRLPSNEEQNFFMCDEDLEKMCDSDVLIFYGVMLASAIIVVVSLIHYVLNFSANYAKLRDRFKDGYVDKRTGTYLHRTATSLRGSKRSLAGTRASLRGSRGSVRNIGSASVSNGGFGHTGSTSASAVKSAAYKNDALKSSHEDLYLQDMRQKEAYAGSNYGGSQYTSNYESSNYGGSVLGSGLVGSNFATREFSQPEPINEIPSLKQQYMDDFDNQQDSYDQRDRYASQASYEANVPPDPYGSANINNGSGFAKPDVYGKPNAFGTMSQNGGGSENAFNDEYGTNLDRTGDYNGKGYGGSNRQVAPNDLAPSYDYGARGSYGNNQTASHRNSQGSSGGGGAGGFSEPFVTLQESDSRGKEEYFI